MGVYSKFLMESTKPSGLNVESITKFKSEYINVLKKVIDEEKKLEDDYESDYLDKIKEISHKNIMDSIFFLNQNIPSFCKNFPITTDKIVDEERKENLKFYNHFKILISEKYEGKYIVIANRDIKSSGDSWDEVKNECIEANHRFIIKIERE